MSEILAVQEIKGQEWLNGKGHLFLKRLVDGRLVLKAVYSAIGCASVDRIEELSKIRRRIEDRLRKDPEAVLKVAGLLDIVPR